MLEPEKMMIEPPEWPKEVKIEKAKDLTDK
jgi:hypothetical protein